jgi:hypothetical protein
MIGMGSWVRSMGYDTPVQLWVFSQSQAIHQWAFHSQLAKSSTVRQKKGAITCPDDTVGWHFNLQHAMNLDDRDTMYKKIQVCIFFWQKICTNGTAHSDSALRTRTTLINISGCIVCMHLTCTSIHWLSFRHMTRMHEFTTNNSFQTGCYNHSEWNEETTEPLLRPDFCMSKVTPSVRGNLMYWMT